MLYVMSFNRDIRRDALRSLRREGLSLGIAQRAVI